MRTRIALLATIATGSLALAACGSSAKTTTGSAASTSAGATSSAAAAAGSACAPVAGGDLVVLTDDKHLQSSDNITPVVNTKVAKAPLTTVLNKVSAALTQDKLLALNKATDVSRQLPADVASGFVKDNDLGSGSSGGSGSITVVAANFSENLVLANVYADALKAAGYSTSVKQSTNREAYLPAVEANSVQVVPEYAATLTAFLDPKATTSGDITATISTLKPLAEAKGLTVLDPAPATDENAFAVTSAFASKYGVKSLSDLAAKCPGGVTLGGPTELQSRPFGETGLKGTYSLSITGFTTLDSGGPLTKNALKQGRIALGLVFSSDSSLTSAGS